MSGVLITWQSIITVGSVIGALGVIFGTVWRPFRKVDKWIDTMEAKDEKLESQVESIKEEMKIDRQERKLLMEGVTAALDGLEQQGCNHTVPVTKKKLETWLNEQAHA